MRSRRSRPQYYKLIGKIPTPCNDPIEWGRWFETAGRDRRVALDQIGPIFVSTVFLGLDHNHSGEGDPRLFETMIFDGLEDDYQTRCHTWGEAEEQHRTALEIARRRWEKAEAMLATPTEKTREENGK